MNLLIQVFYGGDYKKVYIEQIMKVLHINCNYMTTDLHRVMIDHMEAYDQNSVFCPVKIGSAKHCQSMKNAVICECFSSKDRLLFFVKQRRILRKIVETYKIESFDIIHAYTLITDGNIAYELFKRYRIPYIVTVRNTDLNIFFKLKPYLIPLGIKIMENAAKVVFLSSAYRDLMFRKYIPKSKMDIIASKTNLIPNGIDDFWFENTFFERNLKSATEKFSKKKINLLCVGKIDKNKNARSVQMAARILSENGWSVHIDIIGGIGDKKVYDSIIEDSNTTYYEPKPHDELLKFYRCNDIFVLPSHKESFGLVYAEAMSQGMPVIYTKGQGFDGQFDEGLVGFHVDDNDPNDIANAIIRICSDYISISNNCKNMVNKFHWGTICELYHVMYEKISVSHESNEVLSK